MSALLDELEKQSRLLTAQEKVTLARILIEGLDPYRIATLSKWGLRKHNAVIKPISEARSKLTTATR